MSKTLQEWLDGTYGKAVARAAERRQEFHASVREPLASVYAPAQPDAHYRDTMGFPGEWPYVRGVQPTMYRGRLWTMRQYAGQEDAEASNRRYRFLLDRGQTGLSVAFDLPTQIGYDSDHPMAAGEVGKVGVAIDSIHDMRTLFNGIPLDKVSTSMTINSTASTLLALYLAVGQEQGADWASLDGTIQNDVLKEYIARGTYIFPPAPSMRLITNIFDYCTQHVPKWNTISISGYHIREAGSTASQELGFTIANAIAYVDSARAAGMNFDDFGGRLSFFWACHNNFLEEIAKFRASRRIWAKITRDRFKTTNERAMMMRFHTQTGGSTLTAQQPDNNIIRTTIQALAGVMGGSQSLHTNSWDEALSLPSEHAVEIALRTQQIIAFESGVADVIDPLGGAYAIEHLTDQIEAEAMDYIAKIDALGGAVKAIEQGYPQREIMEASYQQQMALEREAQAAAAGKAQPGQVGRVVVGVNRFQTKEEGGKASARVDPTVGKRQSDKLAHLRATRDKTKARDAIDKVQQTASGDRDNLLPIILEAVRAEATLGEISDAMRAVWGEQREAVVL